MNAKRLIPPMMGGKLPGLIVTEQSGPFIACRYYTRPVSVAKSFANGSLIPAVFPNQRSMQHQMLVQAWRLYLMCGRFGS